MLTLRIASDHTQLLLGLKGMRSSVSGYLAVDSLEHRRWMATVGRRRSLGCVGPKVADAGPGAAAHGCHD